MIFESCAAAAVRKPQRCARFGEELSMSLLSWLDDPSAEKGIHFAPDTVTQKWPFSSYAQLASEVYRTAAMLLDHGLERGGIVSLLLSDPRDFIIAFYAAIAAPSFRSTAAHRQHLITVFRTCVPRIVVIDNSLRALAEESAGIVAPG